MRIHFFILRLHKAGGGSNQNAIQFIRALRERGHEISVHTLFKGQSDPPPDIHVSAEEGSGLPFLALQRLCTRVMRREEENADIFFVYGQALLWAAGMYRRSGKKPVVVYLDSHLDSMAEAHRQGGLLHRLRHGVWQKVVGFRAARRVDRFFAASPYLRERYIAAGLPEAKIAILPNAFTLPNATRHETESFLGARLLYAGRLSHEKGVDLLIDACGELPGEIKWQLKIAGDGDEFATLKQRAEERGVADRVEFIGWQDADDLQKLYGSTDILIVPSRVAEPFGRTVVEAMNAGIPVVIPEQGGAAWVAGEAGVTFKNGDVHSLQDAILMLLKDPARRRGMGERGKGRAHDFDTQKIGNDLSLALEGLLV